MIPVLVSIYYVSVFEIICPVLKWLTHLLGCAQVIKSVVPFEQAERVL